MSEAKHTPGPWTIQPFGDETEAHVLGKYREIVATVADCDARLIAAAPALADALARLADACDNAHGNTLEQREAMDTARAALREAGR